MGFAKEEQFLLSVIKAVLHNKNVEVIEEDMDKSVLLKIAKSHRLENFLYYGYPYLDSCFFYPYPLFINSNRNNEYPYPKPLFNC